MDSMSKEQVLNDIISLISDIDKCTGDFVKAKLDKELYGEPYRHYSNMSRLLVAARQELIFLHDYIKEGVNNDVEYTGSTACGEAKTVEYFLNEPKEGGKE